MEDLASSGEQRLKASGRRITSQRKLVLEILAQSIGHLDAGDIYEQAHSQDPRLSLATIYRTLNALKEAGVVRELHLEDEHHHYELDEQDQHAHLVCLVCNRVIEVNSTAFAEVARAVQEAHNFEVITTNLELAGYCAECRPHRSND